MPGRVAPHFELGNKISASIREVFSQKLSTNEGERASIAQASQAIEKQATKVCEHLKPNLRSVFRSPNALLYEPPSYLQFTSYILHSTASYN
jgi:hypothetical protein